MQSMRTFPDKEIKSVLHRFVHVCKKTVPWEFMSHVENHGAPLLPLKAPDPGRAVTTARHKATAVVAVLDAVNMVLKAHSKALN